MNIPAELKYSKEHEWLKVEGDTAIIGITAFAQGELGDIIYVDIDCVGETIAKDGIFGTVEAVKTVSDLCDSLRYIVMSRPDYFEHPKLNMYGQLEKEGEDEEYMEIAKCRIEATKKEDQLNML